MKKAPTGSNQYPKTKEKLKFWHEELENLPGHFNVIWVGTYHVKIRWRQVIKEGNQPEGDMFEKLKAGTKITDKEEVSWFSVDFYPTQNNVTLMGGKAKEGIRVLNAQELQDGIRKLNEREE